MATQTVIATVNMATATTIITTIAKMATTTTVIITTAKAATTTIQDSDVTTIHLHQLTTRRRRFSKEAAER